MSRKEVDLATLEVLLHTRYDLLGLLLDVLVCRISRPVLMLFTFVHQTMRTINDRRWIVKSLVYLFYEGLLTLVHQTIRSFHSGLL